MAAIYLAKKACINISRASSTYFDSAIRFSKPCFSTAFQHAQGSNAVSETRKKQQVAVIDNDDENSTTQFVADRAIEGVRTATEIADAVGDTAKKAMDGVWQAGKEANRKVRETVNGNNNEEDAVVDEMHKFEGPVDTVEYRNVETNVNEVLKKAS
ncbi:uncharacterized protein LOC126667973 isoform X2 [Mercurialis annua]|uniref:uncharacterized protein LOC126667973 isoform X2 n=1 Tax=Mercurialis annua TaxID=3986 RepID=UPI002160913F|nr:uncharacterized protein LOC126667973 isoform X2 [Mercurialis annua]